jgi:hypothetical protein
MPDTLYFSRNAEVPNFSEESIASIFRVEMSQDGIERLFFRRVRPMRLRRRGRNMKGRAGN